ncbi:MAG: flavin reductase [Desulfobacterales bacterium]|nr:flavin reductase [Desulfobacterales bacterium]
MLVLGLEGSPRKKGNTSYLLSTFMDEAERLGARVRIILAAGRSITPCRGCGFCEKKGRCAIADDDMASEVYPLLREAEVIVAATPVYFYGATAQLKAVIDRSQALWSRKYVYKVSDPAGKTRRGFLLSAGATRGKRLFEGIELTAKYFFDAVSAKPSGSLTYKGMEGPGAIKNHPAAADEVKAAAKSLLTPLLGRKKVLFACRENACRSQMASALAHHLAGDKIEPLRGGSEPADAINPEMVEVMAEKGVDMAFRTPMSIEAAIADDAPDIIVTMGCGEACPMVPGAKVIDWDLPDPAGKPIDFMREVRDEIEKRVIDLVKNEL